MNRILISSVIVIVLLVAGLFLFFKPILTGSAEKEYTILSPLYNVDKIYKSMKGPSSTSTFKIPGVKPDELIWITGFKAVMVGEDPNETKSQEFMCHSNLNINIKKHRELFKSNSGSSRLFTLSQGQYEIKFPDGFGVPILGKEVFKLTTQVLNLNDTEKAHKVRHKITLTYIPDKDSKESIKPLMQVSAVGLKLLEGYSGYYNIRFPRESQHGSSCLAGENAGGHIYTDTFDRKFTGHWVVEPGKEVNKTNTTKFLSLPYDTTVHYIAVHLHPFAESVELVDITTGETIFSSKVRPAKDKIGIDHVEYFESVEGIRLFHNHEYQLVSVYNNTSEEPQDSMAVMYLYVLDKEFNPDSVVTSKNQN